MNQSVLSHLRVLHSRQYVNPEYPTRSPLPRQIREQPKQDLYESIAPSPQGEDCVGCGRTYPGGVRIDGPLNLSVLEAAAANFWLSNDELKMVQAASALKSTRDGEVIGSIFDQFGYEHDNRPGEVLQDLLNRVWESLRAAVGPNWTPSPNGWSCSSCGRKEEPGQATAGLASLNAELLGEERQGDEDEQLNLQEFQSSLNLRRRA